MRIAFYYSQAKRLPPKHEGNNPYGALLSEALERQGVQIEYSIDISQDYLYKNQKRVQVLHFHWPQHHYYHSDPQIMKSRIQEMVASLKLARDLGYRIVWTAHNTYPHNNTHRDLDHDFRIQICQLANAIIAHCPANAQDVTHHFGRSDNVFVIPHGHYIDVYPSNQTQSQARKDLKIPDNDFVFGFIGGILPYKGIDDLLDSFQQLASQNSWLVLTGGGPGTYPEQIRQQIKGHPRIVSKIVDGDMQASNQDLLLFIEASDVVVLPFRATMTSGSVILALSRAKPVITPALGCLPSVVLPGAGLLYDPSQKHSLLRAMQKIQNWDRAKSSAVALASVQRFDWDQIAKMTLKAYQS